MFVIVGKDFCGDYRYIVGMSEDKTKLEAMIKQYETSTTSPGGDNLSWDECPDELIFGNLSFKKAISDSFICNQSYHSEDGLISIYYLDRLTVEEVKNL